MRVERAAGFAFHGRFADAERALSRVRRSEEGAWVRAYIAAARGEFANARALALPLATGGRPREIRVAAAISLGSVLRQTGKHRAAYPYDRAALEAARTDAERAHALIGLAADAIGLGRSAVCARRLAEAAAVAPKRDWRVQVRLDWVRTEHAFATGSPRAALLPARRALRRARGENALRHIAKSRLFLGVALAMSGNQRASERELNAALRGARACGAAPVADVARAMLARAVLARDVLARDGAGVAG